MQLFEEGPWWLPDGEVHLQEWMKRVNKRVNGRLAYQYHKYEKAMAFVPKHRTAIDIGAHAGLWTWNMAHSFSRVFAFEPMPEHADCWRANMQGQDNAKIFQNALGPQRGAAWLETRTPGSSGDTGVVPKNPNATRVNMITLDSLDFQLVDFIKIDCEGYELFVLQGAVETLKRCKPVVIVEQKPETGMAEKYNIGTTEAVDFLIALGAKKRLGIQGDYIMSWDAE